MEGCSSLWHWCTGEVYGCFRIHPCQTALCHGAFSPITGQGHCVQGCPRTPELPESPGSHLPVISATIMDGVNGSDDCRLPLAMQSVLFHVSESVFLSVLSVLECWCVCLPPLTCRLRPLPRGTSACPGSCEAPLWRAAAAGSSVSAPLSPYSCDLGFCPSSSAGRGLGTHWAALMAASLDLTMGLTFLTD